MCWQCWDRLAGNEALLLPRKLAEHCSQLPESMGSWFSGMLPVRSTAKYSFIEQYPGKLWEKHGKHRHCEKSWSYVKGRPRIGDTVSFLSLMTFTYVWWAGVVSGYGCYDHFLEGVMKQAYCDQLFMISRWYCSTFMGSFGQDTVVGRNNGHRLRSRDVSIAV